MPDPQPPAVPPPAAPGPGRTDMHPATPMGEPSVYLGPVAHRWTATCAGRHPASGPCPQPPAAPATATPGQAAHECTGLCHVICPDAEPAPPVPDDAAKPWEAHWRSIERDRDRFARERDEAREQLAAMRERLRVHKLSAAGDESELQHIHETLTNAYGREDLSEETAVIVDAMATEWKRYRKALEGVEPAKLDTIADWFDMDDARRGRAGTEVQADLRRWAKAIRQALEG